MKNKFIIIILGVSITLILFLAIFGLKIGTFEIPSISKVINKNNDVNSKIDKVTELTSINYPQEINNLESTVDSLNIQKEKYEQISGFDPENNSKIYETEKYDIGYLWTTLGHYANKNKIKIAIDVKKGNGTDLYDLYFTIQGEYVNISSFITKIENDSDLLFRIYNFKLVPGSSDVELKATFVVKDVNIDNETLIKQSNSELNDKENTESNESSNTINNNSDNNIQSNVTEQ